MCVYFFGDFFAVILIKIFEYFFEVLNIYVIELFVHTNSLMQKSN